MESNGTRAMPTEGPFAPGTLAAMAERARDRALASGALQPIETESELIEDPRGKACPLAG